MSAPEVLQALTTHRDAHPLTHLPTLSSLPEGSSPSSLAQDLEHYRTLFSKLRFSYVEQVTKEKFLRSIVGDPPLVVEHEENVVLEREVADMKLQLKEKKAEVDALIKELESTARRIVAQQSALEDNIQLLETLPLENETLQLSISQLRASQTPNPSLPPSQTLPLAETNKLLEDQEAKLAQLDRELEMMDTTSLPTTSRREESLKAELQLLETKAAGVSASAREAQKRKERNELGADELEERGRWWRAVEAGLKGMVE